MLLNVPLRAVGVRIFLWHTPTFDVAALHHLNEPVCSRRAVGSL